MRTRLFSILLFVFFLVGCQQPTTVEENVNHTIIAPRNTELGVEGKWELVDVKQLNENPNKLPPFFKGDFLYISKDLVAINQIFTVDPKFSSKHVNLNTYLESRYNKAPIIEGYDDENINVMMVRDKDVFSIDLMLLAEDRLCFSYESRMYYFEKREDELTADIMQEYVELAQINMTNPAIISDDLNICSLVGLKVEKIDEDGYRYYDYMTYLINEVWSYSRPRIYLTQEIVFGDDESKLWMVNYNVLEKNEDVGVASAEFVYSQVGETSEANQIRMEDYYQRSISFVNNSLISFEKKYLQPHNPDQEDVYANMGSKYEIYSLDSIASEIPLTVSQLGGEEELKSFKDQVINQLNCVDPDGLIDPADVTIDYSNIGIVRNKSGWGFITSKDWLVGEDVYPTKFSVDLVPMIPIFQNNTLQIPWSRIFNKNNAAEEAFTTKNKERIIIKTDDEIQYYRLIGDQIAGQPELSIQIPKNASIVMFRQYDDSSADGLLKEFVKLPLYQPQVIYPTR